MFSLNTRVDKSVAQCPNANTSHMETSRRTARYICVKVLFKSLMAFHGTLIMFEYGFYHN